MTTEQAPERCSASSLLREESPVGTASTYRAWLLLEQPGPWGSVALRDGRLPEGLGDRLTELSGRLGLKVLLIRRHGAGATSTTRRHCFVAATGTGTPVLESAVLSSLTEVLDLDLAALARGGSAGLTPEPGPLYLVCTHGKHDACCAERGRPVARAIAALDPAATWECSHLGGDRFAGNLLCLPHGIYYGRLTPERAGAVAKEYAAGQLDLTALRGRSAYPFAVQAAEIYLRRRHDLTGVDELILTGTARKGAETVAEFVHASAGSWRVRVRTTPGPPARLSCGDTALSSPPVHELVDITGG